MAVNIQSSIAALREQLKSIRCTMWELSEQDKMISERIRLYEAIQRMELEPKTGGDAP